MNKVIKLKKELTLEEVIDQSSINFESTEEGMDILSFSAGIRAMGLSNRNTQPKKLSNYIRSGYLQVQLITSTILHQFKGGAGISRDDLYDSVCEVFPMTTYANFRKVLSAGVDSEVFIRTRSPEDSRRTLYSLSDEMVKPLCRYFTSVLSSFGNLYSATVPGGLSAEDTIKLFNRISKSIHR